MKDPSGAEPDCDERLQPDSGSVMPRLPKTLGFRDLTLFYIVAALGVRWISTAAASGESAIIVWLLACCGFFLPLTVCVFELSSRFPQEGGLYIWTREAYGDFSGFMAAWIYWMSNLPYFPAVLYFAAGSLLFVGDGRHTASPAYYLVFTVAMIVLITALNVVGVNAGKWVSNLGAIATALAILLLIVLAAISYRQFGSATHFTMAGLAPRTGIRNLIFWSTIFFAFAGCEAGSFMGGEIRKPHSTIPRALAASGAVVTVCYIAGTVALLVALPVGQISSLEGFMQAVSRLATRTGWSALVVPVALLVVLGSLGGIGAFLASTARLPFVASMDRYLPDAFSRIHPRFGTPHVALKVYALAAVLFGLLGQAGTSVEGAYDLLVAMGVVTTFLPYLFLFGATIRVQSRPLPAGAFRVPGGKPVAVFLASLGLFSTCATILLSLFPSASESHPMLALGKILGMTALLLLVGAALYRRGERLKRRSRVAAGQ